MALVVELAEDQLAVRPIHRIVTGLPATGAAAFDTFFEREPADTSLVQDPAVVARLVSAGALAFVDATGVSLLRPRAAAFGKAITLDSERVAVALASVPGASVRYHHDVSEVAQAGRSGPGFAGILLRPVTVAQIDAVAHARTRMPAKSTFFWPKPRTGMVFRPLNPSAD
jgi:hypothetical protein